MTETEIFEFQRAARREAQRTKQRAADAKAKAARAAAKEETKKLDRDRNGSGGKLRHYLYAVPHTAGERTLLGVYDQRQAAREAAWEHHIAGNEAWTEWTPDGKGITYRIVPHYDVWEFQDAYDIKTARRMLGASQSEVARSIGRNYGTVISRFEARTRTPTQVEREKLYQMVKKAFTSDVRRARLFLERGRAPNSRK